MSKDREDFFKIDRSFLRHPMWLAEPFSRGQAWVDLIGLANFADGYFRVRGVRVNVKRGQLGYSKQTLADRWQWSKGKVTRYLNELQDEQQIVHQEEGPTTLISICNYEFWQGNISANGTANGTANKSINSPETDLRRTRVDTHNKNNNINQDVPGPSDPPPTREARREGVSPAMEFTKLIWEGTGQEEYSPLGSDKIANDMLSRFTHEQILGGAKIIERDVDPESIGFFVKPGIMEQAVEKFEKQEEEKKEYLRKQEIAAKNRKPSEMSGMGMSEEEIRNSVSTTPIKDEIMSRYTDEQKREALKKASRERVGIPDGQWIEMWERLVTPEEAKLILGERVSRVGR